MGAPAASQQGDRNARATTPLRNSGRAMIDHSYLHTAIDDHPRPAHLQILADERRETAAAFCSHAHQFFTDAGITVAAF
ncbi:hypothetical protein [Actinomadura rudentiformis]|uniref:Uncharacterized protein n=1 Tax=Actinomadura rudentiformis TaxID=359158 RepID=A0A6H9YU48_9ACTN|nr:hypothetical protein [Actinomadura rudentiformis]KAB2349124.1 hypothetical protein F8566_15480 [Actinomadura rudentiformis]